MTTTADVEISVSNGSCLVKSPYHPAFIKAARNHNGRWNEPTWVFDARDEPALREACRKIYGTDGEAVPCVDVRVDLDKFPAGSCGGPEGSYYALGRMIVERKGRDYGVRLGSGVVVIAGGFPDWGGSMKHPRPQERAGTVLEVRDVPVTVAKAWEAEFEGITVPELETTDSEPRNLAAELANYTTDELCAEINRRTATTQAVA